MYKYIAIKVESDYSNRFRVVGVYDETTNILLMKNAHIVAIDIIDACSHWQHVITIEKSASGYFYSPNSKFTVIV